MRKLLTTFVLVAALSFGAMPVKADPGPVVNWLMDEPASLLDIGLLRLRLLAEEKKETVVGAMNGKSTSGAYYDWSRNRIQAWYSTKEHPFNKALCKSALNLARGHLGTVVKGKTWQPDGSEVARLFSHTNYASEAAPKDHMNRLDKIIEIRIVMGKGECQGSLVSEEVFYKDK